LTVTASIEGMRKELVDGDVLAGAVMTPNFLRTYRTDIRRVSYRNRRKMYTIRVEDSIFWGSTQLGYH